MDSLFKKLNTLVQATLHDVLGETEGSSETGLNPDRLGKDIDREIALLRERIKEAVTFEDQLQQRVHTLQAEVEKWDQQADSAVIAGDDPVARHAAEQMQRARQRLVMAESDLTEHQKVTQELILRVNMLDAAVADVQREKMQSSDNAPVVEVSISPGQALADILKNLREKVEQVSAPTGLDEVEAVQEAPDQSVPDNTTEDDLEQRRQRLTKK